MFHALIHRLVVRRPINPQLPYDFVVEQDGVQLKVQVKHGWLDKEAYRVDLVKKRRKQSGLATKKYKDGSFDFLAVYNLELRGFWIIPKADLGRRTGIWCRTENPTRNSDLDTTPFWDAWSNFGA